MYFCSLFFKLFLWSTKHLIPCNLRKQKDGEVRGKEKEKKKKKIPHTRDENEWDIIRYDWSFRSMMLIYNYVVFTFLFTNMGEKKGAKKTIASAARRDHNKNSTHEVRHTHTPTHTNSGLGWNNSWSKFTQWKRKRTVREQQGGEGKGTRSW